MKVSGILGSVGDVSERLELTSSEGVVLDSLSVFWLRVSDMASSLKYIIQKFIHSYIFTSSYSFDQNEFYKEIKLPNALHKKNKLPIHYNYYENMSSKIPTTKDIKWELVTTVKNKTSDCVRRPSFFHGFKAAILSGN